MTKADFIQHLPKILGLAVLLAAGVFIIWSCTGHKKEAVTNRDCSP